MACSSYAFSFRSSAICVVSASTLRYWIGVTVSAVGTMPCPGLHKQARMCHLSIVTCLGDSLPTFIAKACVFGDLAVMVDLPSLTIFHAFSLFALYVHTLIPVQVLNPRWWCMIICSASYLFLSHLLLGDSADSMPATAYLSMPYFLLILFVND